MNLPSEIFLSYFTGIEPDIQVVDELNPHEKELLAKVNAILSKVKPSYLKMRSINFVDARIAGRAEISLSEQDENFIKQLETYFCQNTTEVDEFIAKFELGEVVKPHDGENVQEMEFSREEANLTSISSQEVFDSVFQASSPTQRLTLARHKFAATSKTFFLSEKELFYKTFSLKHVAEFLPEDANIPDIVRCIDEIHHNSMSKQFYKTLLSVAVLRQYPSVARKCFEFIERKEEVGDEIFILEKWLFASNKDVYDVCVDTLASKTRVFDVSSAYIHIFFNIFKEHLNEKDFKRIYQQNKAEFAHPVQHQMLRVIITLAACKKFELPAEVHADRIKYWEVGMSSNSQHFDLHLFGVKAKGIQIYYLNESLPYEELVGLSPHFESTQEFYSTDLDIISIPINCSTRFYTAVFEVDNNFYAYTHQNGEDQHLFTILEHECIRIVGDFQQFMFEGKQARGSEAVIPVSEFDERSDMELRVLDGNHVIRDITVEKPVRESICSVIVDWDALSGAKLCFTIDKVGHWLRLDGQSQFFPARTLELKLYSYNENRKSLVASKTFTLEDSCHSLAIDENVLFYTTKLEAHFSAKVGEDTVTSCETFSLEKDLYLFCKQYVYDRQLLYHFYNKDGPLAKLNVEAKVKYNGVAATSAQMKLQTDSLGLCNYVVPPEFDVENIESVELVVEHCGTKYCIRKQMEKATSHAVPELIVTKDGNIRTEMPKDWRFEICGQAMECSDGILKIAGLFSVGSFDLVLCSPDCAPNVVATIRIVDSFAKIDAFLPLFFETEQGILIPDGCEVQCSSVSSSTYFHEIEHYDRGAPVVWEKPLTPEHTPAKRIDLTEQQEYLRALSKVFDDKYQSASIAIKPPCLFLKEERMEFLAPRNMKLEGGNSLEPPEKTLRRGCARNNMVFACEAPAPECYAAPGGYAMRCKAVKHAEQSAANVLRTYQGIDPFLEQAAEFSISKEDGMELVEISACGSTAIRIFVSTGDCSAMFIKTLPFTESEGRNTVLQQPSISDAREFAESGQPVSVERCFADQIAQKFSEWEQLSEKSKIQGFCQDLCYEMAFFMKINDKPFWNTWGRRLFLERHAEEDIVSSYLLEELQPGKFNFYTANPLEKMLLILSGCATTQQRQMFLAKCRKCKISSTAELLTMISEEEGEKASDKAAVVAQNRANYSGEQGWFEHTAEEQMDFEYCRMFADLLEGSVITPDLLSMGQTQRNFLLALIWNKKWFVKPVECSLKSSSKLEMKLTANNGTEALLNEINHLALRITAELASDLRIRYTIRGATVLSEQLPDDIKVHGKVDLQIADVYATGDIEVDVFVYQGSVLFEKQLLKISAISTEDLDLETDLRGKFVNGATASELFEAYIAGYSRMSEQALARAAVSIGMKGQQLAELYCKLFQAGTANFYLLALLEDEVLKKQARFACLRDEGLWRILNAPLADECPAVGNNVLRSKNAMHDVLARFVKRAVFTGEVSELFFYLVKHRWLREAEELLPYVSKSRRFQPIISYYRAMLDGAEYLCDGHFNRFNSQASARIVKTDNIGEFAYKLDSGRLTISNAADGAEVLLQKWKYGNATEVRKTSDGEVELGGYVHATLIYQNRMYLIENVKTEIKWQWQGNEIRFFAQGKPIQGLLVVERDSGVITHAQYSDFRGRVLTYGGLIEAYESVERSFTVE